MKLRSIAAAVTLIALVAAPAGCGNKSSDTSSSSSTSSPSKTTGLSSAAAQPADYSHLLIQASDIQAPNDSFVMQQVELNPNGKPGVATTFGNGDGTRVIGDTIMVLDDASQASGALEATKTAANTSVSGASSAPSDVGTGGTLITGTNPDGKAVAILVFAEGKAVTTLEFDSAANDPVPADFVTDVGHRQDAAIKAGLLP